MNTSAMHIATAHNSVHTPHSPGESGHTPHSPRESVDELFILLVAVLSLILLALSVTFVFSDPLLCIISLFLGILGIDTFLAASPSQKFAF